MLEKTAEHLRDAIGLPDLLAASLEAFEDIRLTARACEDQVPDLLATFMTAADAAVTGREAIATAPSLVRAIPGRGGRISADCDVMKVIDVLAVLGGLLSSRLADGAARATAGEDRQACLEAAAAAWRICALMAREDHDGNPG